MGAKAQAPVANFSASVTSGCGPLTVNFRDLSSNTPLSWTWDFGNGQISSNQNPSITYSNAGTYDISLIVKNGNGANAIRMTGYITVFPYPVVDFTGSRTLACAPANISFTDHSIPGAGTISQYAWTFGDGATSNQTNPLHTYAQPGYYSVGLTVTNSQGCSHNRTLTRYMRIVAGAQTDFDWSQASASCSAPFQLNFINQTAGPGNLTYSWDLDNGNTSTQKNPSATYPTNSNYTVKLTATSDLGCSNTVQKTITFNVGTQSIKSPDKVCTNTPATFQNGANSTPLSSVWTFGDGTGANTRDADKAYAAPGDYTVKVVNTFVSCKDSIQKTVHVLGNPIANFTATTASSCKAPFNASFQGTGDPDITGWQWDFGDGATGSGQNATHNYTSAGKFDVKLTVTNSTGCSFSYTKPQFIKIVAPTATLANGPGQLCEGDSFNPLLAVDAVDGVSGYSWSAPSAIPSTSNSATPAFVYNTQGDYNIAVTIQTLGGCNFTTTFNNAVQVGTKTTPSFTIDPTVQCAHQPVKFTSTNGPADHWLWNFGPRDTSHTGPITNFYFSDTGYINITLTVSNHGCAQKSLPQTVYINPPIANFGYKPDCGAGYRTINFYDSSRYDVLKGPVTYELDYGDGMTTGVINGPPPATFPPHPYAADGTYTVTLRLTNGNSTGSCPDQIVKTVNIIPPATDFTVTPNPVCHHNPFILKATGIAPALVKNYSWTVDGVNTITAADSLSKTISDTGTYSLALTVTDIYNCITTAPPHTVRVTGPAAKFAVNGPGGCKNTQLEFTDQSTPGNVYAIKAWNWDFGDGAGGHYFPAPHSPTYTYAFADTGFYNIRFTVEDVNGCTDTYLVPGAVQITSPHAGFFSKDSFYCPGAPLTFIDSSKGYGLVPIWDFGDGSAPGASPTHSFATEGQRYSIKLKVTDQVGCSDSVTRSNYILIQSPIVDFSMQDSTTICPPLQTTFTPKGQYYDSLYWDFGDGTTSTLPNTDHFYNTYGIYNPKLVLRGPGGCLAMTSQRVLVTQPNNATTFTYSPTRACDSVQTNFTIVPPPYTRFTLYFGDPTADSSGSGSITHLYKGLNQYSPALILIDSTGCIVGISGAGPVTVLGATPFFSMDPHAFCDSGTAIFNGFAPTNDGIVSKIWDWGDGTTYAEPDPTIDLQVYPHFFSRPGANLVTLKVVTQSNCAENYTDTLRVHQTPHPTISIPPVTCATEPILFGGNLTTPNIDPVIWLWDFGNGQTSGEQNPTIVFDGSGPYTVKLKTSVAFGCSDETSQPVQVHHLPDIKGPREIQTPVGFPVTIPFTYSSGLVNYSWTPAGHLSCTDCPNPVADPTFSTLYRVTVTDSNNCKYSDSVLVKTICNDKNYFVPNTFSPNGDGVNDVFYPRGSNLYNIQSMRVFNRWGQLVFERRNFPANSAADGWDGRFNGQPAPMDAYVYIVEVICDNAQIVALRGDVTLIR